MKTENGRGKKRQDRGMEDMMGEAKVWVEQVIIPTYEVGEAEKNPMFLVLYALSDFLITIFSHG